MTTAASNASGYMTLLDQAKLKDPNGGIARVIELQQQMNGVLDDIFWKESNMDGGEQSTVRTSLPTVNYRAVAEPSATGKSTTKQINDQVGILTGWVEIPQEVAERGGNLAETRLSEAGPTVEAMMQKFVGKLKYGNALTAPREFTGFFSRLNSSTATNGRNIVKGAGAGSVNTSILFVGWSERTVCCIFPKGTKAGIDHKDFGLQVLQDTTVPGGNRLAVYQERWEWKHGLAIKDWRFAARACDIDVTSLVTKTSAEDLPDMFIRLWHRFPHHNGIREGYYLSRTTFEMLDIQLRDDVSAGGQLKYEEVFGKLVPTFRGIPIRIDDQQLENEAVVS